MSTLLERILVNLRKHANHAEGVQYATNAFCCGWCGSQTSTATPKDWQKREPRGREVAALGSPDPAGVPVEGNGVGQSVCLKRLGHGQQRRFCRKIGTDMTGEEHRGALVDDVERFDHVLLLAVRIGGHAGSIF